MADYHFTTNWEFNAPIEQVWNEIKTVSKWPEWWSFVQKVELIKKGHHNEIGTIRRINWKTALPYTLAFDSELLAQKTFQRIEGRALGELEGKGIWTFSTEGEKTKVQYDWIVKTNKNWMNWFAPVLRKIFEWNHDKVMSAGYQYNMDTKSAYNDWSKQYDTNINKTRDLEAHALKNILENLDFEHCLEIGCGTGKNTNYLSSKSKRVTAVDFSENMLAIAKKKITSDHVQFLQADINKEWNFATSTFDLITFSLVLEHIENLDHIFHQTSKVIKKKAVFI